MVINGNVRDKDKISFEGMSVRHCTSYVYLGVIFTENGSAFTSLKAHVAEKKKHFNRLLIFLARNYDAPFFVKRKVFDAAFSSAILYGCESWLDVSLAPVEELYMSAMRRLLDVRKSTPKLTCLLESGIPSLEAVVKHKQSKFFRKVFSARIDLRQSDPLMFTLEFMNNNNRAMYTIIDNLVQPYDYIARNRDELCSQLRDVSPERTKLRLYLTMNPELTVHPLYETKTSNDAIDDNLRVTFTRVRVCSHRLRSETGRWFGVPPDRRFCHHCIDTVQDEKHILQCPSTQNIRFNYGVTTTDISVLLTDPSRTDLICLKECLKLLQSNNNSE